MDGQRYNNAGAIIESNAWISYRGAINGLASQVLNSR